MSNSNDNINLSDVLTDITCPEILWHSRVKTIKYKFVWTILDYKSIFITQGNVTTTLRSPPFSATKDTCKWFLKMRQNCSLVLGTHNGIDVTTRALKGIKAIECKCVLINSENQESPYHTHVKHVLIHQQSNYENGALIPVSDLLNNEDKLLPQNKLTINCEVTFYKLEHVINDCQKNNAISLEAKETGLENFEKLFNNQEYSDITIHVNGKEYPAHKSIIVGRSPVFAAMLKHDMKENQTNRIDVHDIEDEVFVEALRFIYTGKAQNLETLAFELLPVADKYELEKLKIMCGSVLCEKLSVETVVKILVLADMYNVENLKKRAIDYIKVYSIDVVSKVDSEAWNGLMARPALVKEVFLACLK